MIILITGVAGFFIGVVLAQRLLVRSDRVVGIDNLNDYYVRDTGLDFATPAEVGVARFVERYKGYCCPALAFGSCS